MFKAIRFIAAPIILFCAQGSFGQVITEGTGVIQGIVSDTLGDPIASARVEAFHVDSTYSDITDSQGRYTLVIPLEDGQDSSIVDLEASKPGYLPVDTSGVIVSWGTITFVDFALTLSAGPICGIVIGNSFLEPLENVNVFVAGDLAVFDTTDNTGHYSLAVNYPGIYDIVFVRDDYKTEYADNIAVDYGQIVQLDMAMDRVNWHVDGMFGNDFSGNGSVSRPFKTIQCAINKTNTGDTVLVGADTLFYTGSGNIDLKFNINSTSRKWIVVNSKEGCDYTWIICGGEGRGFIFEEGMDNRTILSGFTIIDGYGVGGGIWVKGQSSPTIENCRIVNCESVQLGGGISIEGGSSPIVRFCEFRGNIADDGGAIGIQESSPTIENCTVEDNEANRGGGIAILHTDPYVVSVTNCIIRGNRDSTAAGQVTVKNSIADINYCNIEDTTWPGQNNFDGDPYYCHPDSFYFHLAENSCCLYSGQDSMFVGAYGLGCGDIGEVYGTVTLCIGGESLFGVDVSLTTSTGAVRSTTTDSSGYYRILVPDTPVTANIHFSHPEPIIMDLNVTDYYVMPGDSAEPLDVCLDQSGCNPYVVGDVNGDSAYNGLDISYGTRYFRGDTTAIPSDSCACPPDSGSWYMVGDVNGSCSYNGLDITYGTGYFKGTNSSVYPCPDCPGAIAFPATISNRMSKDPGEH